MKAIRYREADQFDRICFWIIVIDMFFLPYFTLISVSYSIPVIAVWYFLRGRRTHKCKEYKWFPVVVVIMILSTFICLVYSGEVLYETSFSTSFKRLMQYLLSFLYFFFFRYYFVKTNKNINNIVFWAIVFIGLLGGIYYFSPDFYANTKIMLSPVDNHTRRWLSGALYEYRYNFLWTDPNNVAYATVGLIIFYFQQETKEVYKKCIVLVISVFILLCTMSNGGIIMAVLCSCLYIFINVIEKHKILTKTVKKISISFAFAFCVALLFKDKIVGFFDSNVVLSYVNRFNHYFQSGNITGGRFNELLNSFELFNPIFIIIGSGKEGFTTENGHMYLICMYGIPVYLYFMYVLFAKRGGIKWRYYIVILPLLTGFTVNIAIIEQKYLLISFFLAAYYSARSKKICEEHGG